MCVFPAQRTCKQLLPSIAAKIEILDVIVVLGIVPGVFPQRFEDFLDFPNCFHDGLHAGSAELLGAP